MRRVIMFILKLVIAAAAIINLAALFLFRYQVPDNLPLVNRVQAVFRRAEIREEGAGGDLPEAALSVPEASAGAEEGSTGSPAAGTTDAAASAGTAVPAGTTDAAASAGTTVPAGTTDAAAPGGTAGVTGSTASPAPADGTGVDGTDNPEEAAPADTAAAQTYRIEMPSSPVRYDGRGALDLLNNVHVVNPDGTSAGDIPIDAVISPGSSRREKVITYSATAPDGTELSASRNMSLGSSYTGPSINILGNVLFCAQGEAEGYADKLRAAGLISASDGFNYDISGSVTSRLRRYDAAVEEATIVLSVTNVYADTYETEIQAPMNATGVVLRLTTDHPTIAYGETFDSLNYIEDCYDAEGNDLRSNIKRDGTVDSTVPGDYQVTVYCTDKNGVKSIVRPMTVTVLPQEETGQEETGEEGA